MPWTTDSRPGAAGVAAPAAVAGGSAKLFVGCLPYSKTEADLEPVFNQFGPLQEVKVLTGPDGSSKGAAFVVFQDETHAVTAMSYLQGHVLEGSNRGMNISFAQSGGPRGAGTAPPMGVAQFKMQQGAQFAPPPPTGLPQTSMLGQMASPPGSKIFVGQLPYSRTEADLMQLFSSVGPVAEVIMLTDKKTGEKKGAAFVKYQTPQHAATAASTLNGFLFTGSTRPITVSLAQNDSGPAQPQFLVPPSLGTMPVQAATRPAQATWPGGGKGQARMGMPAPSPQAYVESEPGSKLFVGQLPFSRSEDDISQVFSSYGTVVEVLLHRDAQGQKKGGAFVRFDTAASAAAALDLDGFMFEGSTRPITVSMAGEGVKRRRME